MDIFFIDPGIMCWRVVLPSHEVLLLFPSSKGAFLEYPFDFPFWFSFHDVWWRFQEIGTMLFRLLIRSEKRSVEDVMDLPGRRETKSIGNM